MRLRQQHHFSQKQKKPLQHGQHNQRKLVVDTINKDDEEGETEEQKKETLELEDRVKKDELKPRELLSWSPQYLLLWRLLSPHYISWL